MKKNKSSNNNGKKDHKTQSAEMIIRDSNTLINDSRDIIKSLSSDFDKIENLRIENEKNILSEHENSWSSLLTQESKDWELFDSLYDTKLAQYSELDQVITERSSQYDLYGELIFNLEHKKNLLATIKDNDLATNAKKSISSLLLALNVNLNRYLLRHEELKKTMEDREKKRHDTLKITSENIPFTAIKSQEQIDREDLRIENFGIEILSIAQKVDDSITYSSKGYALLKDRVELLNDIIALDSICDYAPYGHYLDDSCFDLREKQTSAAQDLEYLKEYGANYHVYDVYAALNYKDDYIMDLFTKIEDFDKDLETYSKLVESL